jgi:CubicO group peptidase (beta-lactamase class C family)
MTTGVSRKGAKGIGRRAEEIESQPKSNQLERGDRKMKQEQSNHDQTSRRNRLALALVLLIGAATLSGDNGANSLPTAAAMRQPRTDGQTEPMSPIVNFLHGQPAPTPKLPPPNSGGGGQSNPGQHFEIFNLDTFEANLKAELDSKTVGYSYAIYENQQLKRAGAGGYAVVPNHPETADTRMTVMSTSKTITATGVMKAMEEMNMQGKNITIDSHIAPYLPSEWKLGPRVKELTFRHLLTHTGGLRKINNDPDSYLGLKQIIENGVYDQDFGTWHYANANFCLFRIIIPYMLMSPAGVNNIEKLSWEDRALSLGKTYVSYIQQHVLAPAGLAGIDVVPTGPKPYTRYYKFGDTSAYASDPVDDTAVLRTGAGYWYMSVKEYGKFLMALRNGKIVGWQYAKSMQDNNLGMYGIPRDHGTYWDHNGGYPGQANGSGAMADWMMFPNGIAAVMFVNSNGGTSKQPQDIMRNSFDSAW